MKLCLVGFRVRYILVLSFLITLGGCEAPSAPPNAPAVVTRLLDLLHDPDPDVRKTAALSLGKIAPADAAKGLVESLRDTDPTVRQFSAWALGRLGQEVPEEPGIALARRLDDPVPAVKIAAAHAVGLTGWTDRILDVLIELLDQPEEATRQAVVHSLAWLEAPPAYSALIGALRDESPRVRQGALAALGELADTRSLPLFQDRLLRDPDPGVRSEAAFRLGKFGDSTVLPALRSAADNDAHPDVRRWASWAMSQLNPVGDSDSGT